MHVRRRRTYIGRRSDIMLAYERPICCAFADQARSKLARLAKQRETPHYDTARAPQSIPFHFRPLSHLVSTVVDSSIAIPVDWPPAYCTE